MSGGIDPHRRGWVELDERAIRPQAPTAPRTLTVTRPARRVAPDVRQRIYVPLKGSVAWSLLGGRVIR